MIAENTAAKELWAQIFDRISKQPEAAIYNPDTDQDDEAALIKGLRQAGWDAEEIKKRVTAHSELALEPNINSPGVAPGLEAILKRLANRISEEITATGATEHKYVELAIDPTVGVAASLTNVIMTDEAILSVSSFLFRWCGLIARAYTRTLLDDVIYWSGSSISTKQDQLFLLRRPEIALYWSRIFISFAATGTHVAVPFRPSTRAEVYLMEQIAWSMEYFTIAHEYGHHILGHRLVEANPIQQEFEADNFALRICDRLIYEPFKTVENPYIRTGAGGTIMLKSLSILRMIDNGNSQKQVSDTHPPTEERIQKIVYRNIMQPSQLKMDMDFNNTVIRVLNAVESFIIEFLNFGGRDLVNEMRTPN